MTHPKLHGLPTINMISLYESEDRRKSMSGQFDYLDVPYRYYMTDRWTKIGKNHTITSYWHPYALRHSLGTTISYLNLLRHWYLTTDEEIGIFADDDVSWETVAYWNFTWQEFLEHLPVDWEVVQLIRMMMFKSLSDTHQQLRLLSGHCWGSCFLMRRSYVEKVLERHVKGWNSFDIRLFDVVNTKEVECVETVMCLNKGICYNFPLVLDMPNTESTYRELWDLTEKTEAEIRFPRDFSRAHFLNKWQHEGPSKTIAELMQ